MLEEIDLYLTNQCNLLCDFCSIQARERMEELSLDKIKEIVDEISELGAKELHLTGGEPTIRNDLEEIVDYVIKKGLNTRLITNGTLLSKERLIGLNRLGLKSIMISLDGGADYHNKIRGKDAFQKSEQTIKNAIELGMFVRVNSVAWRDNMEQIKKMPKILDEWGVDVYSVFLGSPLGFAKAHKENVISPEVWHDFCNELQKIAKESKVKLVVEKGYMFLEKEHFDATNFKGRGRGCGCINEHEDFFLVRSNGAVYPCVFYSNEAPSLGNVNEKTFREILDSFKRDSFYKEAGCIPQECVGCRNASICRGGCRGYAKLLSDRWNSKDPRCASYDDAKYIPLCPIVKINMSDNVIGGSSEQVL